MTTSIWISLGKGVVYPEAMAAANIWSEVEKAIAPESLSLCQSQR